MQQVYFIQIYLGFTPGILRARHETGEKEGTKLKVKMSMKQKQ